MNEAIEISNFDAADYLTDEDTIAAYLAQVADEGDVGAFAAATATASRARERNTARSELKGR